MGGPSFNKKKHHLDTTSGLLSHLSQLIFASDDPKFSHDSSITNTNSLARSMETTCEDTMKTPRRRARRQTTTNKRGAKMCLPLGEQENSLGSQGVLFIANGIHLDQLVISMEFNIVTYNFRGLTDPRERVKAKYFV